MTPLAGRVRERIAETGPMPVSDYMAMCLFDPEDGYYTTREPFGAGGDFTTAPEISQMFGELVAVWLYSAWQTAGSPQRPLLAEIGPGRGTLMQDMVRVWRQIDPAFLDGARLALIETSPRLREVQRKTLAGLDIGWFDAPAALPAAPLFVIGNELFDAVPMRQFVKTGQGWRERVVGLDAADDLVFAVGPAGIDAALLPPGANSEPEGAIFEAAPARTALMETIAGRIAQEGGAGLFIDYGHAGPGFGDTLQAVRRHGHEGVFDHPGEADLTSHVDFAALAAAARNTGTETRLAAQGAFLLGMGLLERAGQLGAGGSAELQDRVGADVERLAGAEGMGALFKVLMVGHDLSRLPPHGDTR